jgi:CheY-like chemotaxis protein
MPRTLLLADDSVTIQKVVGISLASEDITLVSVDNGTAAVAKAKEIRPDLILADVVMPQLSGYEVCRQIKADPNLRHVPVLLLTGTFEAFDENKAREVGSDGHITKPFEAQALVEMVNARLAAAAPPPAPNAAASAPAPVIAAPAPIFGEDEPFDFMAEEITEPGPSRGASSPSDALSFGGADELDVSSSDEIEGDPLGDDAMTRVEIGGEDSGVVMLEDDENADTLPPVAAEALDDDSPAATQVLFGEEPAPATEQSNAATRVLFSEPEEAPAPALSAKDDLFADMIGGARSKSDVTATDLGDPFADDPEIAAPAAAPPQSATIVLSAGDEPAWPAEDEAEAELEPPATGRAPSPAPRTFSTASAPSRDELRAMLEKIAWEAFGDVTDRIVRETVQRVEQIAWEVIPKMTEALLREEIRKLKEE